jgi:hypothetical protein
VFHLTRRAVTSFRNHPLLESELAIAERILLPSEYSLWMRMQHRDQRHSLEVLHRFDALCGGATRDERAAALLHDVGKCESTLSWGGRILATVAGPRTKRFAIYRQHEEIGRRLLSNVSSARTLEVLHGEPVDHCVQALREADNF